jgi:tetratricopeptide (TPR) repeat protein
VTRVLREARKDIVGRRDVYGYDLLAWASYKAGHVADARRAVTEALSQNTEDASLYYHAGMIAAAAGDTLMARSMLSRALTLNAHFNPTQAPIAVRTLQALGRASNAAPSIASGGKPRV